MVNKEKLINCLKKGKIKLFNRYRKFTNYKYLDLSDSDLSHSNLSRSNLSHSDLSDSDLSHSNLSRSNLSHSNLSRSNLSHSNLSDSDLSHSNLSRSDVVNTKIFSINNAKWNIYIFKNQIQIGCKIKSYEDWVKCDWMKDKYDEYFNTKLEYDNFVKFIKYNYKIYIKYIKRS